MRVLLFTLYTSNRHDENQTKEWKWKCYTNVSCQNTDSKGLLLVYDFYDLGCFESRLIRPAKNLDVACEGKRGSRMTPSKKEWFPQIKK